MPTGQKHLIECTCILSQFKNVRPPVYHKFVVFSVIDDDDNVEPKYVKCNNCDVIHKVHEIGKSEIVFGAEFRNSVVDIEDIKLSLSEKYVKLLTRYDVPLHTWEEVKFLIDNELWGSQVLLTSDKIPEKNVTQVKVLVVIGENLMKVESFVRSETFGGDE